MYGEYVICATLTFKPAGLLKWVFAMVNYYGVAKGVEPKRKKVRAHSWAVQPNAPLLA